MKLKKTTTAVKTMFNASEGKVGNSSLVSSKDATNTADGRRALSKLVDFPGDVEEIRKHLDNSGEIDPAGNDAYGLSAIHKFASWNKTVLLDLLIPKLTPAQLNAADKEGKTALHWAVEMASVRECEERSDQAVNVRRTFRRLLYVTSLLRTDLPLLMS